MMGTERMAPGKQNAAQIATDVAAPNSGSVGKATQVQLAYGQATGNAGVDNGGKGRESVRGNNFLTDIQRGILVAEYIGRVNAALTSYMAAAIDLRVDKLTEKQEEFPVLGVLLLAAGGKGAESVVMGACALLRRSGRAIAELAEAGVHGVAASAHELDGKMLGMSEKSVEFLVSQATDQAKDKLKGAATTALGGEQDGEKATVLSFIDYTRDAAMGLFQRFREWPIGRADDAQLLALFAAFEGSRHTPTMYRKVIGDHVQKYMGSHAKDIGHKEERKPGRLEAARTETRVAYVTDGRNPPMLAYVENEYSQKDTPHGGASHAGPEYNAGENALGFEEEGSWSERNTGTGGVPTTNQFHGAVAEADLRLLGYVEPELREVALATHQHRWLQAPATYTVHYPAMNLTKGTP